MTKTEIKAKVGDWLIVQDPIYGSMSQGEITKIADGRAYYFNRDAFDGMGGVFDESLDSNWVTIEPARGQK